MSMNRVFFIILIFAFLLIPLSINNVNDDGISYFDLVVEISEDLFGDTKIEEKDIISLSEDQKQLISEKLQALKNENNSFCLLYTSPSPRDATLSRMPSSA